MRRLRAGAGVFPWSAKDPHTPVCAVGKSPRTSLWSPDGEEPLQHPLVDYRPVERLKLPARFDDNRGHVCCGKVVEMTLAHNDGEIDESILKSGKSVVHVH